MLALNDILLILKKIIVVCILLCIVLVPAYFACANESSKQNSAYARCGSWIFGWSFVGWLFALFVSAKK